MVALGQALGAHTTDDLRRALREGRLQDAPGVGPVTEAKLRAALEQPRAVPRRSLLPESSLAARRRDRRGARRRGRRRPAALPRRFASGSRSSSRATWTSWSSGSGSCRRSSTVARPRAGGRNRRHGRRRPGRAAVVGAGARVRHRACCRATGSDDVRRVARRRFRTPPTRRPCTRALGVPYLPPELREAPYRRRGSGRSSSRRRSAATCTCTPPGRTGRRPCSRWREAARALGYEYVAICDHTRSVRVVPGLDADDLRRQGEEIAAVERAARAVPRAPRHRVRRARATARSTCPDDVLAELDWVQASVHAGQRQSRAELTRRTLAAVDHPAVSSISHPQGRIINHRPPNAVDLEALFDAVRGNGHRGRDERAARPGST